MSAITEQCHGAVLVLRADGPLVQDDARILRERATEAVGGTMGRLAVDLAGSPYIDSEGLEALLDIADRMADCGQTLRLAGVTATVREVLEITALAQRFEYYDDTTEAVRSFL